MSYRLGWLFGNVVAKMGISTLIRINVIKDAEAGVFVGTSTDLAGLVIEAETLEGLLQEAHDVIPRLLDARSHHHLLKRIIPSIRYNDCSIAHA